MKRIISSLIFMPLLALPVISAQNKGNQRDAVCESPAPLKEELASNTTSKSTPTPADEPSRAPGTYAFTVYHEHGSKYFVGIDLGRGSRAGLGPRSSSNSNSQAGWGNGILTIAASDQTVSYTEINGDRNPDHNFTVSCQSLKRALMVETREPRPGITQTALPILHLRARGRNYNFVGVGQDQSGKTNYQMANPILSRIVEVCKLSEKR